MQNPISPAPPRSTLSILFMLSLGVVYPGFLVVIFLMPGVFENLFNSASGYFISGLGLTLLGVCFVLATLHFRSASRQYQTDQHPAYPATLNSQGDRQQLYPAIAPCEQEIHQENNNAK